MNNLNGNKTYIGIIVTLVMGVLQATGHANWTNSQQLTDGINMAITLAGALLAMYGRTVATKDNSSVLNFMKSYQGVTEIGDTSDFTKFEDIVSSGASFQERSPVSYTQRFQDNSGTCVAQTTAKMLEVADFKNDGGLTVYSATPIFQSRANKPNTGMYMTDALNFSTKNGAYLEKDVPSEHMSDLEVDDTIYDNTLAVHDKPLNSIVLNDYSFYKVAEAVNTFGACMTLFKASYSEWCQDVPTGLSDSEAIRHAVTAVDTISYKGVEYIIIEDSYGTWQVKSDLPLKAGQRAITKVFFDKHCYGASAFTKWTYGKSEPHKHMFASTLVYGSTSPEIALLQQKLQQLGYFPVNVKCTGYYGKITGNAVLAWQIAYKVADLSELNGKSFGPKSILVMNTLLS